jgi:biopolymer transport protein ExbD
MSSVYKRGPARISANLTPMIDMTFLLIVFFVLVSNVSNVESQEVNLPRPDDPASEQPGEEFRAVVNVIPGEAGEVLGYKLGGRTYAAGREGIEPMAAHLAALYAANPGLSVNLRADRQTAYEWIEPVMQAVSRAARQAGDSRGGAVTPRINLVVVREN